MENYLHLHKEHTAGPQERYRGQYLLKHFDYELSRAVGRKGEVISDIRGGMIRIVIDGFADPFLIAWIFDTMRKEDGSIVTLDEQERSVEKFYFSQASVSSFRLNYDSRVKEGVMTVLTIEATEITTNNDLYFERR